ncbi:MAG TPA: VOC family protein [Candidatus Binataceae bacterium]|nr:VOC family protein [Candidatus Binataceae bacterium]
MYDEIKIPKLYCYHCGAALVDRFWQSKSGDCVLKRYNSLEEFGAEFDRLGAFRLVEICPECEEFLEVELRNPSQEHRVYLAERDKEWRAGLIEAQTARHPNHDFGGYNGTGEVFYTNAWCRACQDKGYAKGRENPEMSPAHIAAGKIWASQQVNEKQRKRRQASFLGIDAIGICVGQLVTSIAFYEKLGFVREKETDRDCLMSATGRLFFANPRLLLFQTNDEATSETRRRFDLLDHPTGLDHIRFLADDLDILCADLKAKGIVVERPPTTEHEQLRFARLRDPDGNKLVFIEQDEAE